MSKIVEDDINYILRFPIEWGLFKNKTVLITGASGCLPAYMVETLLKLDSEGYNIKILALVRNELKAKKRFNKYKNNKNLIFIVQDVIKPIKHSGKINFIIHGASIASPKYYKSDPVGTLASNSLGTYNLLELAVIKKVKSFLFFSSGEIYGQVHRVKTRETDYGYLDPLDIRSCYAESKRIGETMCVSFYEQFGVPAKIVRPFHTFGPGMNLDDGRVFSDFVRNIVNEENIEMKSSGQAIRSFCYLADAAIAFFLILLKGKKGEAYNVGGDQSISILGLAKLVVSLFPEKKLKVVSSERLKSEQYIESRLKHTAPGIRKIKKLGWAPKYSIKEGFKRTVLSFNDE